MVSTLLTGCSVSNVDPTEAYDVEKLQIGVIRNIPEIRETQIEFEEINFDFLSGDDFDSTYDAIFITKDNFSEASNAEYASINKASKIPFYFIDSGKSHVNFIAEDLSYKDEPDSKDGMYIRGVFYIEDKFWGYGLYNDTNSKKNIKGVYSRVFEDISKNKNDQYRAENRMIYK
jgi:hypothetical protein